MEEQKGTAEGPDPNAESAAGHTPHNEPPTSHDPFWNLLLSQLRKPAVLAGVGGSLVAAFAAAAVMRRRTPKSPASNLLVSRAKKLALLRLNADPITVAAFLKILGDEIEQAIEAARNAGLALEIQAGREVNLAIQNATNALSDVLTKFVTDLDNTIQDALNQLQTLVESVVNQVATDLGVIIQQVQQIINTLPFHDHQPQLTSTLPNFVVPASPAAGYPAKLQFNGNFEFAAQKEFTPTLDILRNGTVINTYAPSTSETQNISFLVQVLDMFPVGSVDPTKFNYVICRLSVPWEKTILWPIKKRVIDVYSVIIGALPGSPGKITHTYTKSVPLPPSQKPFQAGPFYQDSGSDGGNNDKIDVPYEVTPEANTHVVRNTSRLSTGPGLYGGDWSYSFVSDDADKVVYNVTTIHHGAFGSSGFVHFWITFNESYSQSVDQPQSDPVELRWGDSQIFNPDQLGTDGKFILEAFDGSREEVSGEDTDGRNPFLQTTKGGDGSITLTTADPKTINWP